MELKLELDWNSASLLLLCSFQSNSKLYFGDIFSSLKDDMVTLGIRYLQLLYYWKKNIPG